VILKSDHQSFDRSFFITPDELNALIEFKRQRGHENSVFVRAEFQNR
jgi:hypothetical protein